MVRGHAKEVAQQKNAAKKAAQQKKGSQLGQAEKKCTFVCPECKVASPVLCTQPTTHNCPAAHHYPMHPPLRRPCHPTR